MFRSPDNLTDSSSKKINSVISLYLDLCDHIVSDQMSRLGFRQRFNITVVTNDQRIILRISSCRLVFRVLIEKMRHDMLNGLHF